MVVLFVCSLGGSVENDSVFSGMNMSFRLKFWIMLGYMMFVLDSMIVYCIICYSVSVEIDSFVSSSICVFMYFSSWLMNSIVIIVLVLFGVVMRFVVVIG